MLKKIGRNTIKYRNIVSLVFAIVFAISIVGTVFLVVNENKINSDMVSYLDDDSQTKRGLVFLKEQFDIRGNATVIVRVDENSAEDGQKFRSAIENVKKLKGVTNVTWYGAVESFYSLQNDFDEILKFFDENKQNLVDLFDKLADTSLGENLDDIKALLALTDYYGKDFIKTGDLESYLRHETKTEGVYDYVVLVLTDIDAGNNAYALLDGIKSEFSYTSYAATGTTETAKQLLDDTMKSLPWFIVWGIASVLIILFFTTKSYLAVTACLYPRRRYRDKHGYELYFPVDKHNQFCRKRGASTCHHDGLRHILHAHLQAKPTNNVARRNLRKYLPGSDRQRSRQRINDHRRFPRLIRDEIQNRYRHRQRSRKGRAYVYDNRTVRTTRPYLYAR